MSLLVTGGSITNVTYANADSITFNAASGLINVYNEKKVFSDPLTLAEPPYITSLVVRNSAPKVIEVTFSQGGVQSIHQAYSINSEYPNQQSPGNPATGLEIITPTLHKISFQHDILPNSSLAERAFFYRMEQGDAVQADSPSIKVCSYIKTMIELHYSFYRRSFRIFIIRPPNFMQAS